MLKIQRYIMYIHNYTDLHDDVTTAEWVTSPTKQNKAS